MHTDFAKKDDLHQIAGLFHRCFGESPDQTARFFQCCARVEDILICREGETVCSMLVRLPAIWYPGEKNGAGVPIPGSYLYGVCTDPAFRGRGLMGQLLNRAKDWAVSRQEAFLCLVPASDSLYQLYARFGYRTAFWRQERVLLRIPHPAKGAQPVVHAGTDDMLVPCPSADWSAGFSAAMERHGGVCLAPRLWPYLGEQLQQWGGGFFKTMQGSESKPIVCACSVDLAVPDASPWGGTLYLREDTGCTPWEDGVLLAEKLGCTAVRVTAPIAFSASKQVPYGMVLPLPGAPAFIQTAGALDVSEKSATTDMPYMTLMLD